LSKFCATSNIDDNFYAINDFMYYTIRKQSASFLYYIENGSPTLNATKLTMSVEFIDLDECDKEKIKEFPCMLDFVYGCVHITTTCIHKYAVASNILLFIFMCIIIQACLQM